MKSTLPAQVLQSRAFSLALALTLASSALSPAAPPSDNKKNIPVHYIFDFAHTDFDGNPSGEVNGIRPDVATTPSYSHAQSVLDAYVGRNFGMWLIFSNIGRSLEIDFSRPIGCGGSAPVDHLTEGNGNIIAYQSDGICDTCHDDGLAPTADFAATDFTFQLAMGRDLDDLDASGDCVLETIASLEFTDPQGQEWVLMWGPRQRPGGWTMNPRSDPVFLKRSNTAVLDGQTVAGNYWFFQTTGDHLATLYRRDSPSAPGAFLYYGQYTIPYSGYAVAQSYDPSLMGDPEHCTTNIPNIGTGLVPPIVTLVHDESGNTLTALAVDHCDDFSGALESFDWYANGALIQAGQGNLLDLSAAPSPSTIEVVAVHPGWLAMLPNLTEITRAQVEGSAVFQFGDAPVAGLSFGPLVWNYPRGGKDIQVTLTVLDNGGAPVAGATVEGTLSGGGLLASIDGTTDGGGSVDAKIRNAPSGQLYCVQIDSVSHPTLVWDSVQPTPSCQTKP